MDSELRRSADKMAKQVDQLIFSSIKELHLNMEMLRIFKEEYQALSAEKEKKAIKDEKITMSIIPQS